jgi:hypothetical protein
MSSRLIHFLHLRHFKQSGLWTQQRNGSSENSCLKASILTKSEVYLGISIPIPLSYRSRQVIHAGRYTGNPASLLHGTEEGRLFTGGMLLGQFNLDSGKNGAGSDDRPANEIT